jgi:hypothetical protein
MKPLCEHGVPSSSNLQAIIRYIHMLTVVEEHQVYQHHDRHQDASTLWLKKACRLDGNEATAKLSHRPLGLPSAPG